MKAFTLKIKTAVMLAVLCLAGLTAFCQYQYVPHHYSITAENRVDLPDFTEIDTSIIRNVTDDVTIEYVRNKSNGVGYFHYVLPLNWEAEHHSWQQTVRIPFRINDMVIFGDSLYFCGTDNANQPVFGWLSAFDIGNNRSSIQLKYVVTPRLQDVYARFGGNTFFAYTPRKLQLFQIGEVKHIVAIASALYMNRPMTPPTPLTPSTLPTDNQLFEPRLIFGETDLLMDIVLAKNDEVPLDPNLAYSFPYKVYFSVDHMPADELEDNSAFLTYDNLAVTDGYVSVVGHVKQAKLNGRKSDHQEIINCVFAKPERILDTSIFNDGEREGRQTKSVFYIPSYRYSFYYQDKFHSEFVDDQNGNRALSKVQVIDGGNDQIIFASEAFCVKSPGSNTRWDGIAVAKMKMPSDPNIYNEKFYETKDAAQNRAPKTPVKALVGHCSGWSGWESNCTPDGEYAFLFDDFSDSSNPISYIIDSKNDVIGSYGSYVAISDENVNFLNSISRHIDCQGMPVLSGSSKYDDGYSSYMFRQRDLIASNTCLDTYSGIIHIGHKEYSAKTIKNHPWIASSRVDITKEYVQKYRFTSDQVCVVVDTSSMNSEKSTAKMIQNSIAPNPAHEKFTISSDEYISYIEVVTFDGQTIKTEQVNDYSKEVNVSGSKKGVYMVRIHYKNADVEILKLVIQ